MATLLTINMCNKERHQLTFSMNTHAPLLNRAQPCSWAGPAEGQHSPSCDHTTSSQGPSASQQAWVPALRGAKSSLEQQCSLQSVPFVLGLPQDGSVQRTEHTALAMGQNGFALLMGQMGLLKPAFLASHDSWGAFHNSGCIIFLSCCSCQSCLMEKTHLKNPLFPKLGQI